MAIMPREAHQFWLQNEENDMRRKITVALALAIAAISMSVPASANPKPDSYSSGYQDAAGNRNGW
jgi:hypothetical protein